MLKEVKFWETQIPPTVYNNFKDYYVQTYNHVRIDWACESKAFVVQGTGQEYFDEKIKKELNGNFVCLGAHWHISKDGAKDMCKELLKAVCENLYERGFIIYIAESKTDEKLWKTWLEVGFEQIPSPENIVALIYKYSSYKSKTGIV